MKTTLHKCFNPLNIYDYKVSYDLILSRYDTYTKNF